MGQEETRVSPYTITFEVPGLPGTINSMGRAHWSVKAREAKKWRQSVVWAVGRNRPAKPLKYAEVTYTRVSAVPMDHDNLVGSFKHVQDGLVDARVIENDRYTNIGAPLFLWEKGKINQGFVRVTVVERREPWIPGGSGQKRAKPSQSQDGQTSDSAPAPSENSRPPGRARRVARLPGRHGGELRGSHGHVQRRQREARSHPDRSRPVHSASPTLRRKD